MGFTDLDWAAALLRAAIYVGAIATAGSVLFFLTVRGAGGIAPTVRRQIWFGTVLLFLVEPLRYVQFQLAISGGDWAMAFAPEMRWMALETPVGQAALVRLVAALVIVLGGLRAWPIGLVAALAMVASFAVEGHTASHVETGWKAGWLPAALLILHLAMAHWWLGALFPLRSAACVLDDKEISTLVHRFGQLALGAVVVLFLVGGLLMALLAGWQVDLARTHQRAFIAKLVIFAAILAIAALNKLCWTQMLRTQPARARTGLRRSLDFEIVLCGLILLATAVMTSFPPASE